MDWRFLPPLSALRAFSAFAGADTLEQAGAGIGVTHAAVSQQIRTLEAHLGVRLVDRGGRRLALTAAGLRLAAALEEGFGRIGRAVAELTEAEAARPLRITTTPAFASGWLMPRLPDFRARNPAIDLTIDPTAALRELGTEADVALRYGNGDWPGVEVRCLLETPVVVVASPRLVPEGAAAGIDDLAQLPWLQELGTSEATAFLEGYGMARKGGAGFLSLPGNLMLDAARDGQGIAVIARAFVEADLVAGRLRVLHEDRAREGYFLVTARGSPRPAVRAFCRWIVEQSEASFRCAI
jgi:LysR family glycine cleavage system transcriptional activator